MAFLSCSASALSWSSSFILAECVDRWRRLRQEHPPVRAYVVVFAAAAAAERERRPLLCSANRCSSTRPLPTTDPQASADRPTDGPTCSTCCRRPLGAFSPHSRCRWSCRYCGRRCSAQPPPPSPPRLGRRRRRCWRRRRHSSHGALARGKRVPSDEGGTVGGGGDGGGRGVVVS